VLFLMLAGFFQFFGQEWFVGFQTSFISLIGFYAMWSLDEEYLKGYCVLAVFNLLSLSGHLPLFGYVNPSYEQPPNQCELYFGTGAGRCVGYDLLTFLRTVGLLSLMAQAIAAFASFRLFRTPDLVSGAKPHPSSSYESIFEASTSAKHPKPALVIQQQQETNEESKLLY